MISENSTEAKVRDMRPPVVVSEAVSDDAGRARVLGALATLDWSGVLRALRQRIDVERGVLARSGPTLPADAQRAASFALEVFQALGAINKALPA